MWYTVAMSRPSKAQELTPDQRRDIQARYEPGPRGRPPAGDERVTLRVLAEEYGMTTQAIRYILSHPVRDVYNSHNSYETMHGYLRLMHGPASDHTCVDCGDEAAQWAYLGDLEDERVSDEGLRWSPHLESYAPKCIKCHAVFDHAKEECHRGHPLSGDNLYISPKGVRQCRACNKLNKAARALKNFKASP